MLAAPAIIPVWGAEAAFWIGATSRSAAPAIAQAWGLNTLAWSWTPDPTLSDINTTTGSTKPSSLNWNWTTKNPFPYGYDNPITPGNGKISYNSSNQSMELAICQNNANADGISTVWLDNAAATVWQGRAIDMSKPMFLEWGFSFDESLAPAGGGFTPCPSCDLYCFGGATSTMQEYLNKSLSEFQKAGAGAVGYYQNTFESNVSGGDYEAGSSIDRGSVGLSGAFTAAVFNTFQWLYIPTTYNGGTGIMQPYANGVAPTANGGLTSEITFTLTGPATNCCQPGDPNPNGAFTYAQTHPTTCYGLLVFTAGVQAANVGWPCYITSVKVWGADASVVVTQS